MQRCQYNNLWIIRIAFFLLLGVIDSVVSFAQVDSTTNIANYDYFLEKELPAFEEHPSLANTRMIYQDTLIFNKANGSYSKYKMVDGTAVLLYENATLEEMLKREGGQSERKYIQDRAASLEKLFEYRVPQLYAERSLYNRIVQNAYADAPELKAHMGGLVADVKRNIGDIKSWKNKKIRDIIPALIVGLGGSVAVQLGYRRQEILNLSLPEALRVTGTPDFQVNLNVNGDLSLSNKLVLPLLSMSNFSNFGEELFKARLQYKGNSEEIIKEINFIQTNFDTKSSLIPSTESLLGVNMRVQFGRLFITGALGQVRSQIQTEQIQGGAGRNKTKFQIRASDYEDNQHFFLAQYFYENYEKSIQQLPVIQSGIRITRIEVWVTNRQNKTQQVRQAIAFMDMAEPTPYNNRISSSGLGGLPSNLSNSLYNLLSANPSFRSMSDAGALLNANGLASVADFEKSYMRKLESSEYYLNDELGYILLRSPLQSDEVLGVAYEFTYNGQLYQVGEFASEQIPSNTNTAAIDYSTSSIFLKMLKATAANVHLPIWNLMMKNVYSLGYGVRSKNDVSFQILYEQPGGTSKNFVPTDAINSNYKGVSLLEITKMDALDPNGKYGADGEFDFINKITFISDVGKIVFPHKKPFGEGLRYIFQDADQGKGYLFNALYDTLKVIAKTNTALDRYLISGESNSSVGSNNQEIRIGFNLRPGSVKIFSGGYQLIENQDYIADYNIGTVRIINPSYINAQTPLNVQYENNNQFIFRNYLFMGLRWDYYFKNKKWILGGTLVNLNESPFYTKLEYNNDPINNSAFQVDLKYHDEMPWLSKALSVLPNVNKKESSTIKAQTEVAMLVPGHSSQIGTASNGGIFIDDFEAVRSSIDIKTSFAKWILASTPEGARDENNNLLFPEAALKNDLRYGYNRSRLSWYILDPYYQDPELLSNPLVGNYDELLKPEVRLIQSNEIFPNRSYDISQSRLPTFDITFNPYERGPYNFNTNINSFNSDGTFIHPQKTWGGIMRSLNQVDFVVANVEYIEFWMMDPFINHPQSSGGSMYFHLGNISEDILKDSYKSYENGLPSDNNPTATDTSAWAKFPVNPTQLNFAFDNTNTDRSKQDVGFDGYTTGEERNIHQVFLEEIATNFGAGTIIYRNLFKDPASDDYRHYSVVVDEFGKATTLLDRYKFVSNPDGNSPVATSTTVRGSFLPPDSEDINNDNVLNENESYFQYQLKLTPNMRVGNSYIVDVKSVNVTLPNRNVREDKWYLFRIPIRNYQMKYGEISGFQSIRFMRLFFHGFKDTSLTFRFATMSLVANQWRLFENELDTLGGTKPIINTSSSLTLQTVSIEDNERKTPVPYVLPPGVIRQSNLGSTSNNFLQNEQSQALVFKGIAPGETRGIFKRTALDLRNYEKIKMFVHIEGNTLQATAMYAVLRLGNDINTDYYEIKIPLKITPDGSNTANTIWPKENQLDFLLSTLSSVKSRRELRGVPITQYYAETLYNGIIVGIMGTPSLASVDNVLLGVYNSKEALNTASGEIWFDELQLTGLNEAPSWAMTADVNIKFANLAKIGVSGNYKSIGWGSLEQRLGQRMQEDDRQISLNSSFDLHRLIPEKAGLELPIYFSFTEQVKRPKYYPHISDVLLEDYLSTFKNQDSILQLSINYTSNYQVSLPNIILFKNTPRWFPLSPSLFTFNYTYSSYFNSSPILKSYAKETHQGGMNYTYAVPIGNVEPFKNIQLDSKYWRFIKELNFRYLPENINFRLSFDRLFSKRINRNLNALDGQERPYFNKYLKFTKTLNIQWALTRSLRLNYSARQESFVDEPYGDLDNASKQDSFWKNALNLGRSNYFTHALNVDYKVPFQLFPFLDWANAELSYKSSYAWKLNLIEIGGNAVENTQRISGSIHLNIAGLLYKSRHYRMLTNPLPTDDFGKKITSFFINFLSMLKSANASYSEDMGTIIPGWAPNIETWGQTFSTFNPGVDFIFGYTPSLDWFRNTAINNRWIINNPLLSQSTQQTFRSTLNIGFTLVPFKDFSAEITMSQNFSKVFSFQMKDINNNNELQIIDPVSTGSFSTSYLSFTLFNGLSESNLLDIANRLNVNRQILSKRLATSNPYLKNPSTNNNYYEGYNGYAQDVLIPAFIAAFANTDPQLIPTIMQNRTALQTNPFANFPFLPNWTISYNGLAKILGITNVFNALSITHGYSSRIDMSNYSSSLKFADPFGYGWPSFIDPKTGNFIPYFLVPSVSISENYSPLIRISGAIFSRWQFAFAINRTRQSTLSLSDFQISEANVLGINAQCGWTSNDFNLPFSMRFMSEKPSVGNITLNSDVSVDNNRTQNIRIDENVKITSGGLDKFNFNISMGLIIDKTLNTQIYFEQLNTYPLLSSSPPIFVTRVGLKLTLNINYNQTITPTNVIPKKISDVEPINATIDALDKKK